MNDEPSRVDGVLSLLSDAERRGVVEYFGRTADETATLEELSAYLERAAPETDGGEPAAETAKARLHHVHLPKLADRGVVDYDPRSGEVRYCPDERVEAVVEVASDL